MFRSLLASLAVAAFAVMPVRADEDVPLVEQPAPFTVWLDIAALTKPDAPKPALPIWFESFEGGDPIQAAGDEPPKTRYRLRLRRMPSLHREVMFRIYFDDLPGVQPTVTGWSESGREHFRNGPLGDGIGLPTSESLVVVLDNVDYIDIEIPGNGTNLRGVLASSLRDATTRQTQDLESAPVVIDPFGKAATVQPQDQDSKLFGRVKATIDRDIVRLSQKDAVAETWHVNLAAQPLSALVTFDVLNADFTAPPVITINEGEPVYASVVWPDLADPAFRGEARAMEQGLRFQYTGWLRAQCAVSGNQLRSGLNKITISLSEDSGAIAVRNVELQLKHNWQHFDYILSPVNPPKQ